MSPGEVDLGSVPLSLTPRGRLLTCGCEEKGQLEFLTAALGLRSRADTNHADGVSGPVPLA